MKNLIITTLKNKLECPKCSGQMVQGFIPDKTHHSVFVGSWHAGHPQKSFWTGAKAPIAKGLPIGAFRCQSCGFLEFYAAPNFAAL